ncbi:hypothetical protein STEG23_020068 [Scotinomys teguina]
MRKRRDASPPGREDAELPVTPGPHWFMRQNFPCGINQVLLDQISSSSGPDAEVPEDSWESCWSSVHAVPVKEYSSSNIRVDGLASKSEVKNTKPKLSPSISFYHCCSHVKPKTMEVPTSDGNLQKHGQQCIFGFHWYLVTTAEKLQVLLFPAVYFSWVSLQEDRFVVATLKKTDPEPHQDSTAEPTLFMGAQPVTDEGADTLPYQMFHSRKHPLLLNLGSTLELTLLAEAQVASSSLDMVILYPSVVFDAVED